MQVKKQVKFIDGKFTPAAAKEILIALINQKIQFHSLQNFSSEERFGKSIPGSQKRIEQLKAARDKVSLIIDQAAGANASLRVTSTINIEFEK